MLDIAIRQLIKEDRFYAEFIQQMDRQITRDIPTAAISVSPRLKLAINPDFWASLDLRAQVGVLKHEALHLLLSHFERIKRYADHKENVAFYNICADLAVNSLVPEIPVGKGFVTVEDINQQMKLNLEKGNNFEYYVDQLRPHAQQVKAKGPGQSQDEHNFDGPEGKGASVEAIEQAVKYAARQAAEACERAGTQPSNAAAKILGELFHTPNQWRREIQKFPQEAETVDHESTRKRRNRRFGLVFPGQKPLRRVRIGVGVDVSGSMFDEATLKALGDELAKIVDAGAEAVCLFFDAAVQDEFTMTSAADIAKYNYKGGGGTLFKPVFDRATELQLDGLIMLTDTYNADQAECNANPPRYPVLWGVVQGPKDFQPPFGKAIQIDPKA